MAIQTFMFFDLETTGLPTKDDPAKITELTLLSVRRRDLEKADGKTLPPISKLSFLFNPQKKINPQAAEITGLTNAFLANQPLFGEKVNCINSFLKDSLAVCLVAHNGNCFDFKIIKSEYENVKADLPNALLCVDSLKAFKEILTDHILKQLENLNTSNVASHSSNTLDNSEWPDLDITPEDWQEIERLTDSFSELTTTPEKQCHIPQMSFKLTEIYKKLLKKEPIASHRAEADCIMLLECIIAVKDLFLPWADKNCKLMSRVKPF